MYIHFCCCPCARDMFQISVCSIHTPLDLYTDLSSLNPFLCEWTDCHPSVPFFLEFIVLFCSSQFVLKSKENQSVSLWEWRLIPFMNLIPLPRYEWKKLHFYSKKQMDLCSCTSFPSIGIQAMPSLFKIF